MPRLDSIFEVRYGHSLALNRLTTTGPEGIPFVSRKMGDNGISAYVKPIPGVKPYPAGELTCALSGNGVLTTFIQQRPFYTGYHIACLKPVQDLTLQQLLYYSVCIEKNRYRYSFGRQANRTLGDILLPDINNIPDWVGDYEVDCFDGSNSSAMPVGAVDLPSYSQWEPFKFDDLFYIKKGKRLTKAQQSPGTTPFIGALDNNNGLSSLIKRKPNHKGNTITVVYNGNGVAEAFYQAKPFWATDDVNVLYPKFELNPYIALFLATIIRKEKYRFSYGRKWHLDRMRSSVIKLPVDGNGNPDWALMDTYIKSLPYSSEVQGKVPSPNSEQLSLL